MGKFMLIERLALVLGVAPGEFMRGAPLVCCFLLPFPFRYYRVLDKLVKEKGLLCQR